MPGFDVSFDAGRRVVVCRIASGLGDWEVKRLAAEMEGSLSLARTHGHIRLLWDNRANRPFSKADSELLASITNRFMTAEDRTAILVNGNVAKATARAKKPGAAQLFASENAAYTWLSVGTARSA